MSKYHAGFELSAMYSYISDQYTIVTESKKYKQSESSLYIKEVSYRLDNIGKDLQSINFILAVVPNISHLQKTALSSFIRYIMSFISKYSQKFEMRPSYLQ